MASAVGVPDPPKGQPAGVFEDQDLQALYDRLVATGRQSLIDGLEAGALIDERDIQGLADRCALTDEVDVPRVYDSLLRGSLNHLRAFNKALPDLGVTSAPQLITQQERHAIGHSARETCGA